MNENTTLMLRGRVGTELRSRTTQTGRRTIRFRLAVPQWRVRDDGVLEDRDPHWYTVRAWDKLAENALTSLHKGDPVLVMGRPTVNAWKDEQGEVRSEMIVTAQAMGHDITFGWTHFGKMPTVPTEVEAAPATQTGTVDRSPDQTGSDQRDPAPAGEEVLAAAPV